VLDPLVLSADRTFELEEEYIAGWLGMFPTTHLTPYVGISSVPPACFVRLRPGNQTLTKYWDFDPGKGIHYTTDAEYEEHFRTVFRESVRRRLRSDAPVLAELSGGMDSSSIVCVADTVIAEGEAEAPRLDTVSYYDDSEPDWNESPYFTKVEEKRGRTGCHVNVTLEGSSGPNFVADRFCAVPGSRRPSDAAKQIACYLASHSARVVLSGTGGDEVMGGLPTPLPELADLVAHAECRALAHQLRQWALYKRKPWWHLLWETAQGFLPFPLARLPESQRPACWLDPKFAVRNRAALTGYRIWWKLFSARPSFQENVSTLETLRRQLAGAAAPCDPLYEARYSYLDRDLLEFLFAIPREQLVRPGERRSLMRRALRGIVPGEILNRKRKASLVRTPIVAAFASWTKLLEVDRRVVSSSLGILNTNAFCEAIENARLGERMPIVPVARAVEIEIWLRGLSWSQSLTMRSKEPAGEKVRPTNLPLESLLS
jgi:asparagine synthase (glutamine-hydrolysing)